MNCDDVDGALAAGGASLSRSYGAAKVAAGFGSPADDATARRIDLNEVLVRHPQATFFMRARGDAMAGAGIADGDVLIVDRAIAPVHGHVVVAVVDGELLCRRLHRRDAVVQLRADEGQPAIAITEECPLQVWGVVTTVIRQLPL